MVSFRGCGDGVQVGLTGRREGSERSVRWEVVGERRRRGMEAMFVGFEREREREREREKRGFLVVMR